MISVVFYSSGGIRMENSCWPPSLATLPSKIAICASWLTNSTRERTPARSTSVAVSFQQTHGPSGWNLNDPRTTVDGDGVMEKHSHYLLHSRPLRTTHYLTFRVSQWRISWTRFIQKPFRWLMLKHKGCTVVTSAFIAFFFFLFNKHAYYWFITLFLCWKEILQKVFLPYQAHDINLSDPRPAYGFIFVRRPSRRTVQYGGSDCSSVFVLHAAWSFPFYFTDYLFMFITKYAINNILMRCLFSMRQKKISEVVTLSLHKPCCKTEERKHCDRR